jgi:CubicO group peptidase (beta-lactamase class C family)
MIGEKKMENKHINRREFLIRTAGISVAGGLSKFSFAADPGMQIKSGSKLYSESQSIKPWMEGFPPSPDRIIRFSDGSYRQWPQLRWSYNHIEELAPTKTVWRGEGQVRGLDIAPLDLEKLTVQTTDGEKLSFQQALHKTYTDGILVLHRGKIVYEKYFAHTNKHTRHIIQSATKSLVGTLAEDLVHKKVLDRERLVPDYIPELRGTAWDDATLANVMDMLVSMQFDENYLDPNSEVYQYLKSAGMVPLMPEDKGPVSIYKYLPQIKKEGDHGRIFAYREPNINVLGWIIRRATGKSLADLISEWFWQPIGTERDAYFMLDGWGAETTMCSTLRDFARFGELIRNNGVVGGRKVLHHKTIDTIFKGGDRSKFALGGPKVLSGWSYKSQWWIRHLEDRTCPEARGSNGQHLYIDRKAEVVFARFGSAEKAPSALLEPIITPLIDAIIKSV